VHKHEYGLSEEDFNKMTAEELDAFIADGLQQISQHDPEFVKRLLAKPPKGNSAKH
jgi:hypothetical protein